MPMARVSSNVISYSSAISALFEMGLPTSRGKAWGWKRPFGKTSLCAEVFARPASVRVIFEHVNDGWSTKGNLQSRACNHGLRNLFELLLCQRKRRVETVEASTKSTQRSLHSTTTRRNPGSVWFGVIIRNWIEFWSSFCPFWGSFWGSCAVRWSLGLQLLHNMLMIQLLPNDARLN